MSGYRKDPYAAQSSGYADPYARSTRDPYAPRDPDPADPYARRDPYAAQQGAGYGTAPKRTRDYDDYDRDGKRGKYHEEVLNRGGGPSAPDPYGRTAAPAADPYAADRYRAPARRDDYAAHDPYAAQRAYGADDRYGAAQADPYARREEYGRGGYDDRRGYGGGDEYRRRDSYERRDDRGGYGDGRGGYAERDYSRSYDRRDGGYDRRGGGYGGGRDVGGYDRRHSGGYDNGYGGGGGGGGYGGGGYGGDGGYGRGGRGGFRGRGGRGRGRGGRGGRGGGRGGRPAEPEPEPDYIADWDDHRAMEREYHFVEPDMDPRREGPEFDVAASGGKLFEAEQEAAPGPNVLAPEDPIDPDEESCSVVVTGWPSSKDMEKLRDYFASIAVLRKEPLVNENRSVTIAFKRKTDVPFTVEWFKVPTKAFIDEQSVQIAPVKPAVESAA